MYKKLSDKGVAQGLYKSFILPMLQVPHLQNALLIQ